MSERELDAVSRLASWLEHYGKYRNGLWREDLAIVLELSKRCEQLENELDYYKRQWDWVCSRSERTTP